MFLRHSHWATWMNDSATSKSVARPMSRTERLKQLTLLEGEALAVWMELSEEDKEDYAEVKKVIKSKLLPTTFMALEKFNGS